MALMEILSTDSKSSSKTSYGWKIMVLSILCFGFSFLSGWNLGKLFLPEKLLTGSNWIVLLIFTVLFLVFAILEILFAKGLRFWSIVLQTLIFSLAFYFGKNSSQIIPMSFLWGLGVWLILLLCFWIGGILMRRRKEDLLKIRWNEITKRGLTIMLIGINLFICLQWLGGAINQLDILFSPQTISAIIKPSTPILAAYFKNFDWNMMVDDFVKNLITDQTEKFFEENEEQLAKFPTSYVEQQKKAMIEANSKTLKEQLSKIAGFSIQGTESLNLVVYQFLFNKYRASSIQTKQIIILIIVAFMFLVIRILAFFISLVTRWVGWLIYELLLSSGFAAILTENRVKENTALY